MLLTNKNSKSFFLFSVLFITVFICVVIVAILPDFYIDDFAIFYGINNNPNMFYSNPLNHFYLSLRPVSYLILKLNYFLWGTNSIGMKLNAIFIHLLLIIIYFRILILVSQFFNITVDYKLVGFFTLIFSINPESSMWIFLINNQTELLSTFFYALAFYTVLKYLVDDSSHLIYLILYLIFYGISVYTKQQPLHLPLLIIFLLTIYKKRIVTWRYKNALLFSCFGMLVAITVSYLNM